MLLREDAREWLTEPLLEFPPMLPGMYGFDWPLVARSVMLGSTPFIGLEPAYIGWCAFCGSGCWGGG